MAAQVAQSARACAALHKAPSQRAVVPGQAPGLEVLHIHMVDPANLPLGNQVLGVPGCRLEAVGETHHVLELLLCRGLGQGVRLLRRHGDGLFQVVGLARLYRRHGNLKVGVVGGADVHRLHIGAADQVVIIGEAPLRGDAVLLPCRLQLFLVDVTDGHQFQIGASADAGLVNAGPDAAQAHRAHSNHFFTHNASLLCENSIQQTCLGFPPMPWSKPAGPPSVLCAAPHLG